MALNMFNTHGHRSVGRLVGAVVVMDCVSWTRICGDFFLSYHKRAERSQKKKTIIIKQKPLISCRSAGLSMSKSIVNFTMLSCSLSAFADQQAPITLIHCPAYGKTHSCAREWYEFIGSSFKLVESNRIESCGSLSG